jgi:HD superfamily phosphohydrolase
MRESHPWGLDEELLRTDKVITDPVHGDIFVTRLERLVIDSPPFQRLRRVRQLGATHYVYPGATHTRFAHSLGSMKVAQDLMDAVVDQQLGPHPQRRDLFEEWREDAPSEVTQRIAESTVLVRLGALLHDLTHVPFGHAVEDDLGLLDSHDENIERFEAFWEVLLASLPNEARSQFESDELDAFIQPLVLSKYEDKDDDGRPLSYAEMVEAAGGSPDRARQYEFAADIVGNTICADLLDYLRRDHMFAGLPLAVGERYLAYFYVTPTEGHRYYPARMVLRIQRHGRERTDVITELLKHLRYRYELSERALVHHAKLAADSMIGKALVMWRDELWTEIALQDLRRSSDHSSRNDVGRLRYDVIERFSAQRAERIDERVEERMESELQQRGDDGFLEWLRDWSAPPARSRGYGSRRAAVHTLTNDLLDRRLFKQIAHLREVAPGPEKTYERFKDGNARRALEQGAARFAEVRPSWHVLTWIPEPKMRLKIAEVLVDSGSGIKRFVDQETRGDRRGADIYDAHRGLWAVSVYVHRDVKENEEQVDAVLAYLASELEVRIDRLDLPAWANPWEAPDVLAARCALRNFDAPSIRSAGDSAVAETLAMVDVQRKAAGEHPGETISERTDEFEEALEGLLLARDVLRAKRFAVLAGTEPELYATVLASAAWDAADTRQARREQFKQAAILKLQEDADR